MSKTKQSKNHHHVPKAVLRNFCVKNESLHYAAKETWDGVVEWRNINSVFRRRHYNSFVLNTGEKNDALERFFGEELDNYIPDWTQVFANAIQTGRIQFDSHESRERFVFFFYYHTKRTPDFMEPLVQKVAQETFSETGITELERRFRKLTCEERQKINSRAYQESVLGQTRVENMSSYSGAILERFRRMKIICATPRRQNKQFIVSSNPVVRFEGHVYQELGTPGVEMWTTLAPRIAVGFVAVNDNADVLFLDDSKVRKINRTLAKNSRAIGASSSSLIASLAKDVW